VSDTSTTGSSVQIARPLSTYKREAAVQALLDSWNRLSARAVLQRIKADTAGAISNEALVAAARALLRSGAREEAWEAFEILTRRVAGRTYRHLSVWGVAGTSRQEDLTRDIVNMMMECVLSTEPQQEFWECRFWTCFDRRVRTILRDQCKRHHDDAALDEIVERTASATQPVAASASDPSDWLDNLAARTLLERLPEPLRTAF
jgi:hypothetical protein